MYIIFSCILSKFYIKPQLVFSSVLKRLMLYLIEILHQTTTSRGENKRTCPLYLIEILHQTTTAHSPQDRPLLLYLIEILHQTTTLVRLLLILPSLYLIEILHQTTTPLPPPPYMRRCILSKFYIKPQQRPPSVEISAVVSYRNSTSNHNLWEM